MKKTSFLKGEDHQHFGLRKLSIGVTSVLLGTTFMLWGGSQVRADNLNDNNAAHEQVVEQQKANTAQTANNQTQSVEGQTVQPKQEQAKTADANKQQAQTVQAAVGQSQVEVNKTNSVKVTANNNASQQTLTISNPKQANTVNAAALAENKIAQNQQANAAAKQTVAEPAVHYNNPEEVTDWNGFTSALRNRNVDAIVLDNDIYATGPREFALNSAAHDWQDWNISRKVTITSKDVNHRSTINFGNHFISFWDQNHRWYQDNNTPWDITLKDVNITNTDRVFSPFFFNNESIREANKDKITFDNVNQNGDMLLRSEQVNVELKGNVNINSHLHNGDYSAIYAHSVQIDPNANVTMNVTDDTYSEFLMGNAAIHIVNAANNWTGVEVGENATLRINPDVTSHNTKGIITTGANSVILDRGAKVEMNLGTGNSTGIFGAQNLVLNEGSSLNIKTAEDNNGVVAWGANNNGHHVSPITLGYNRSHDSNSTLDIKNGATLRIVRSDSNCPSIDALISFGGTGCNDRNQFNLNVEDGATLDLQDAAHSNWHAYGTNLANYLGDQNYLYNTGMIAMYGVNAYDHVNFGNVKYVNLQRTGYQHGILMRLEGGCNPLGDNAIIIRGNNIPLSQWVAGNYSKNADYTWNIDRLCTQNKVGDFSYNYNGRYQRVYVYPNGYQRWNGLDFADANANVAFSDGSSLYDHQDFNQNFNWWSPQRISFGSALQKNYYASVEDANALTTHVNANTNQTPSLNVNNIVLTWRDDDGNVVEAPAGYTVAWDVAPDTSKATAAGQPDRTGSVLVTLKNGKQEVVSVPVNVLSARAINGLTATQNEPSTIPTAQQVTDTSDVNRFGISSVQWITKPSVAEVNSAAPGTVRVNYNDGTSQILTPTINVVGAKVIYHARVNDADALTTHVNATTSVPSLNAQNIHFTWMDQNGEVVAAPSHYRVTWATAPDTSRATVTGEPNRQGEVIVSLDDGSSFYVNVPVNVLSARTQHDGFKIKQNDTADLPTAAYMTDTSDVDQFGIKDVAWASEPDISSPGAQVYGRTRVDYNDGTSQYLDPYLDVLEVKNGQDHKDDRDVYFETIRYVRETTSDGSVHYVRVDFGYARVKTTDYAYPVGDPRRVTYSNWQVVSESPLDN